MYKISYDDKAINSFKKLERKIKERIIKKLDFAEQNPHYFFKKLTDRKEYKLRVNKYRIIADINNKKKTIKIRLIGHRKNIYKNHSNL